MRGTIQNFTIGGYECLLYLPPDYDERGLDYPVVYVNGEDELQEIMEGLEPNFGKKCEGFILLSIVSKDWGEDYSPWSAPGLRKNDKQFGGGAGDYLHFLVETVKPFMDKNYRTKGEPENTVLLGYSLGGLAALYALYTCGGAFGKIGSLSGSLWFEGWIEFIQSNTLDDTNGKVYLSLGTGEERSRNPRMARVGDWTRKTAEIIKHQLNSSENLVLEWNNGGHFTETAQRYQKAVLWLMGI